MSELEIPQQSLAEIGDSANIEVWRMKACIRRLVDMAFEPSFEQFEDIPGFRADNDLIFGNRDDEIIYWIGLSPHAGIALVELLAAGEIVMLPARPEIYSHNSKKITINSSAWRPVKFRATDLMIRPTSTKH